VPPRATFGEQLKYRGQELGTRLSPIGLKQYLEGRPKGSAITGFERGLGFRAPGSQILNPAAREDFLAKKEQRAWQQQERQINRDRQQRGLPPLPPRRLPRAAP